MTTSPASTRDRRQSATLAAEDQGGVISRAQLRMLGVDHEMVEREVRADRWATHGLQTVAVHRRPLGASEQRWRAVWEVGHDICVVDGVSALLAHGLTGYDEPSVHVSVVHRHRVKHPVGVTVHKIGRRLAGESILVGVPRTRVAVAAIRAAHWAVSERQAALLLSLAVQQRLTTPVELARVLSATVHRRRRAFIAVVVGDLVDGVRSLGELDFARMCRERGLPEPIRQVVRRGPHGRIYLDVRWPGGLVVEVDGSGHQRGLAVSMDNLRQNSITLANDRVLRIDLMGLRVWPDLFMDQVELGLRAIGLQAIGRQATG